jgi:hypothetical protein
MTAGTVSASIEALMGVAQRQIATGRMLEIRIWALGYREAWELMMLAEKDYCMWLFFIEDLRYSLRYSFSFIDSDSLTI